MRTAILLLVCVTALTAYGGESEYWISLASYRDADDADVFVDRASEQLNRPVTVRSAVTDEGVFYRVTSGPYIDRDAAESALALARADGFIDAWLYAEPVADLQMDEPLLLPESSTTSLLPPEPADTTREERRPVHAPPTEIPDGYQLHQLHRDGSS